MIYPSPLSKFSMQQANPVKKMLRLDLDTNATFSPPVQTNPLNQQDFKQFLTKTAGSDGWVWPDSLADNFGDGYANRVSAFLHLKPETNVYLDHSPYLSDAIENAIAEIPTDTADARAVRAALAYDGMSPNYLETRIKSRVTGNPQCPFTIARGMTYYTSMMSEIREIYHECYFRLDPDINTKMVDKDYQVFGLEMKSGGLVSSLAPTIHQYGYGSSRLVVTLLKNVNGLYLNMSYDTNANGANVPGLGLIPSTTYTYWFKNTLLGTTPDPDRPIAPGVWYKWEFSHRRSLRHDDLATGHTWIALTDMRSGVRKKYLEQIGGVHMGVYEDPITRIFMQNPYSSSLMPSFNWSAGHQMYDRCPFVQE